MLYVPDAAERTATTVATWRITVLKLQLCCYFLSNFKGYSLNTFWNIFILSFQISLSFHMLISRQCYSIIFLNMLPKQKGNGWEGRNWDLFRRHGVGMWDGRKRPRFVFNVIHK